MVPDYVKVDVGSTENSEHTNIKTDLFQEIRIFNNACDQNSIKKFKTICQNCKCLDNLNIIETLDEQTLSDPKKKKEFRNEILDKILTQGYNTTQDNTELLFFAAAKFDLTKLESVITDLKNDPATYSKNINKSQYCDSVIVFVLKYGNVSNRNFLECMTILLDAEVDVNKFDINGKTALDFLATLHDSNKDDENVKESLKEVTKLLLKKKIFEPDITKTLEYLKEHTLDIENYDFLLMDLKTRLFYCVVKNKIDEFLKCENIKEHVNSNDGENTLLQLASKSRKGNMLPVVKSLLKSGADPNLITESNTLTSLELASSRNQVVFEEILKNEKTKVTEKQYFNLVGSISKKAFETLLESDKIETNWTYDKTGNTPLHYAIYFSHKKAIQKLLKRHSSLLQKNNSQKCALDIIDPEDLEKYFDYCLALDNYTSHFTDINYKMQFRFNCLVSNTDSADLTTREVKIVSKIGKRPNLEHLLTHPFIHTFITLKWFKVKWFFYCFLFLQSVIFLLQSVLFYRLSYGYGWEFGFCVILTFLNIVFKAPMLLWCKIENKCPKIFILTHAGLYGFLELLLIITMVASFFQNQFRAFLFVEMAILFLLTAGYHRQLSKWSLMLQQVFKTFTALLIFFSIIVVAFSVGFHILCPEDGFFKSFFSSVFKTYIMTTGEFNLESEEIFASSGFPAYLMFLLFAMSMALVIVNFWTGVAVTDIERIEKHSEINASKNVIVFMLATEFIYNKVLKKLPPAINCRLNPLLFLHITKKEKSEYYCKEKCEVDFFVNKEKQFDKADFPAKVDDECFEKIKSHYFKLTKKTTEQIILNKLEEVTKMLEAIKKNNTHHQGSESHDNKAVRKGKEKKGNTKK